MIDLGHSVQGHVRSTSVKRWGWVCSEVAAAGRGYRAQILVPRVIHTFARNNEDIGSYAGQTGAKRRSANSRSHI